MVMWSMMSRDLERSLNTNFLNETFQRASASSKLITRNWSQTRAQRMCCSKWFDRQNVMVFRDADAWESMIVHRLMTAYYFALRAYQSWVYSVAERQTDGRAIFCRGTWLRIIWLTMLQRPIFFHRGNRLPFGTPSRDGVTVVTVAAVLLTLNNYSVCHCPQSRNSNYPA